jgi:hypothetical protein
LSLGRWNSRGKIESRIRILGWLKKVMQSRVMRMFLASAAVVMAVVARAQVQWVGGTQTFIQGSAIPKVGAYLQPYSSLTFTTQTFPISAGQSVTAIVSTNNFATTTEIPLSFDRNIGNNTQWYGIIGPYSPGTNVQFYLRANGPQNTQATDNNNGQNYGFTWRYNSAVRRGAILQWFATDYVTMQKRLPEVVMAGYSSIYLPPPSKGGAGGFSVGYNPFDRFDLGDRFQLGTVKTRYGTTEELISLIQMAKRFGLEVYCDLITNHNDNRATSGINTYPDLIPEDFHIRSSTDTGNNEINFNNAGPLSYEMLNRDLVGLTDIAHENGNQTQTGTFTLPAYASMNMWGKPWFTRHPLTPQYYPGGTPVKEDVREYLTRWSWYLSNVIGFDGFRIDAVKHTTPSFFMKTIGQAGYESNNSEFIPKAFANNPNAMIFGEVLSGDNYEIREFAKTGMQIIDFPLAFKMRDIFNSNGFGNIGSLGNGFGIDANTGLGFEKGGLDANIGVTFVQSHDDNPPTSNNLAHAFTLTRPGSSVVYYDGNNLNPTDFGQFPRPGRFDSLGNGGDATLRMVNARYRFGRGVMVNRFQSNNLYVYERQINGNGLMLVGLNIRGDFTPLTQTVDTAFAPGTVLEDLSGQRPNVTVGGDRKVTITVPANSVAGNNNNARGYVLYAPVSAILSSLSVTDSDTGATYAPSAIASPTGSFATNAPTNVPTATVVGDRINIAVNTSSNGDQAFLQLDRGDTGFVNTAEGLTDGFVAMNRISAGQFTFNGLNVANLPDGLHMIRMRVFNNTGNLPGVFNDFYFWFNLSRGLGTGWTIDGDLAEFGPNANWWQNRNASSNSNRLDGIFLKNDDQYLYVGLAGRVDASENLTNGMSLLIDPEAGSPGGLSSMSSLNDDSGPATRLLSNTNINLSGFAPKVLLSSFRNLGLNSGLGVPGTPVKPKSVGAQAGAWRVNDRNLSILSGIPSLIAMWPRPATNSSLTGLEAAIPLRSLLPFGTSPKASMNFMAFLGNTGEQGTTLPSTNATRGALGGRPAATSWVSNQFLPSQPNIVNDPGTSATTATSPLSYTLRRATVVTGVKVTVGRLLKSGEDGLLTQTVTIFNGGDTAINGPIWLTATLDPASGFVAENSRGFSIYSPRSPYFMVQSGNLAPGASATFNVILRSKAKNKVSPTYTLSAGKGAV